jgi:hypothetical protein
MDEVSRSHKEMAQVTTGIPEALEFVEGMPICLQGVRIQPLQRVSSAVSPTREAMDAA